MTQRNDLGLDPWVVTEMSIVELIRGRFVLHGLEADSKDEAIQEMVDFLVQEEGIAAAARDTVLDAVIGRERTMSSGMEDGVALPHAVTDAVEAEVAAIGIAPAGIPFDAFDAQPVRIIILHVSPTQSASMRVQILRRIARLLDEPDFRSRLLGASDAGEVVATIRRAEARLPGS